MRCSRSRNRGERVVPSYTEAIRLISVRYFRTRLEAVMKAHVERATAGHTQLGLESLVDDTMPGTSDEVRYLYGLRALVNELYRVLVRIHSVRRCLIHTRRHMVYD